MKKYVFSLVITLGLTIIPSTAHAAPFKNCMALRAKYPNGVAKSVATANAQKKIPKVSAAIYKANKAMDENGDGVACALISTTELPKVMKCPTQQISKDTKEVFGEVIRCVKGWAVGVPKRFSDNSGEAENEGEWLLAKPKNKWVVVGVFHIYFPIGFGPSNNPYNGGPVNLDLIPPMSVQCILWDAARYPEFIPETGCPNALP